MDEMLFFKKNALLANLCKEWDRKWSMCHDDKEKLVRLVLMQQSAPYFATFCYQGKGLTKEYCKQEFSDYINGRVFNDCDDVLGYTYQIYVDPPTGFKTVSDVIQMLWCDCDIVVPMTKCPKLYISNRSNVDISLEGYNSVVIYLFDDSNITISDSDDESTVTVFKYSNTATVDIGKYCLAKVKIFDKQLKL